MRIRVIVCIRCKDREVPYPIAVIAHLRGQPMRAIECSWVVIEVDHIVRAEEAEPDIEVLLSRSDTRATIWKFCPKVGLFGNVKFSSMTGARNATTRGRKASTPTTPSLAFALSRYVPGLGRETKGISSSLKHRSTPLTQLRNKYGFRGKNALTEILYLVCRDARVSDCGYPPPNIILVQEIEIIDSGCIQPYGNVVVTDRKRCREILRKDRVGAVCASRTPSGDLVQTFISLPLINLCNPCAIAR